MTGQRLQEARESAGLTQQQVADHLGVTRQTVVTWEGKAEVKRSKADRFLQAVAQLTERVA